jgi:hypothetical protein
VSVQGKFEHLGLQVEEEEVMTSLAIHYGGRLLSEQSLAIHYSQELHVAKIHGEAQGYKEHFLAGRDASLV